MSKLDDTPCKHCVSISLCKFSMKVNDRIIKLIGQWFATATGEDTKSGRTRRRNEKKQHIFWVLGSFVVLCKNITVTLHIWEERIPIGRRAATEEQVMPKWNTLISEFANNNENNTKTMKNIEKYLCLYPIENCTECYSNNNIGKNKWRVVIHSIGIKRKFICWNEPDEGKWKKKPQRKVDAQFYAVSKLWSAHFALFFCWFLRLRCGLT